MSSYSQSTCHLFFIIANKNRVAAGAKSDEESEVDRAKSDEESELDGAKGDEESEVEGAKSDEESGLDGAKSDEESELDGISRQHLCQICRFALTDFSKWSTLQRCRTSHLEI